MPKAKTISPEHLRALENLKIATWCRTQLQYIWFYYGLQAVAAIICMVGLLTDYWYEYEGSHELITISGATVQFVQRWNMGTTSIAVDTEYCESSGPCAPDKSQKIYFDGSEDTGYEFPDNYSDAVSQLLEGRSNMEMVMACALVGILVCSGLMWWGWYELHKRNPSLRRLRNLTIAACVLASFSAALGIWGVSLFLGGSKAFRDLVEADSFVPDTEPKLQKMGWSAWLVLLSMVLSGAGLVFTYLSYQFVITGVEVDPEIIAERNARVKAYLNDVTNTSHQIESRTMDTMCDKAVRNPGWTTQVRPKVSNIPQNRNWKDIEVEDLEAPALTGAMGSPIAGQGSPWVSLPGTTTEGHSPVPTTNLIRPRAKMVKGVDVDGISTTFSERKRQVTRAPKPEKPARMRSEEEQAKVPYNVNVVQS